MAKPIKGQKRAEPLGKYKDLLLMLIPGLSILLLFNYVPMYGIVIAFKDFILSKGIFASPWVGFSNFERLFAGQDFVRALINTITISLMRLGFGFFAPIVLALLLNEVRFQGYKRAIQTLTYLPFFLSWVILGGIFLMFFSLDGPVNQILMSLGKDSPIEFLTNSQWFVFTLILTGIWQGAGYGAVVYLAALSGISPDLYEAAMIDGANRWKQTLHITIPCLRPTILVLFILSLGGILNAGFDQIYNMYSPAVFERADILDTYVLRRLTTMDFGLSTAAGLFKSLVGFFLIVVVNAFVRKTSDGEYGVW